MIEDDHQIQFTGIVVTYNEARRLRECLRSLAFCDQLLVVDLGSTDNSVEIARECGAEIIPHEWVPVVEHTWSETVTLTQYSWILRADPDEVFPEQLVYDLHSILMHSETLGMIYLPHQNYFRGKALTTTIWGGTQSIAKVFHKDRVTLRPIVHYGISIKEGFEKEQIERNGDNFIRHYWADSYSQLLAKHWRYIKQEGKAKYSLGERFSWRKWAKETWYALKKNLVDYQGQKGGTSGIFLSMFYAWYVSMSWLSLLVYQIRRKSYVL